MKKKFLLLVLAFGVAIGAASFNFGVYKASATTIPYTNTIVGLGNSGNQPNLSRGGTALSFSNDGRYALFSSPASNLVTSDTNGLDDLFVRDRQNSTTVRVNVDSSGNQTMQNPSGNLSQGDLYGKISANGQYVVFTSDIKSLAPTASGYNTHVFVHNMVTGSTNMVDIGLSGSMPNNTASDNDMDISRDGRYIVFTSQSTNLVSDNTLGRLNVFVRDTKLGTTTLISKSDSGTIANDYSYRPTISCDGSLIAFFSDATNLVPNDTNGFSDVFLVNRIGGNTIKDLTFSANAKSYNSLTQKLQPAISCDGSTVIVPSTATNLTAGVTGTSNHIYAYDTQNDTFELIDKNTSGTLANQRVADVAISGDGRLVVFETAASNLDSAVADSNSMQDIYVRDRKDNTTQRVNKINATTPSSAPGDTESPAISADGRYIGYTSPASNLVSGDTNNQYDAFVSQSGLALVNY